MTESIRFLSSTEAAARLGVKTSSLYAYVSRGLLPRHPSPDGRTSLFDPADVARLSKRAAGRRGAPSDVTVASELSLVDVASGGLWYRGVDALRACRELRFEEIAWWLWTGSFERMNTWRADGRTQSVAARVQSAMAQGAQPAERLRLLASAVAEEHERRPPPSGTAAASNLMGALVHGLPGAASVSAPFATVIVSKLARRPVPGTLVKVLDAALSATCEHGLTHSALIARLTTSAGGGVASAVAAAMTAALPEALVLDRVVTAIANAAETGRGVALSADVSSVVFSNDVYRNGDPRARVLLEMLREASPGHARIVDDICRGSAEPSTASFALAAVVWACGLAPGSAPAVAVIAQSAGWIAHALEERRKPTPYRPRLAYTGTPPGATIPRRTIDTVRQYLSRQEKP